ncbi:MAG TPA: alpha/beta hydrolase [Allosphingosinicella sp.]|jgi:lysophospholipase|nr:alpha/beta hydrolase [Allosphingosinicella sp.]
MASQAFDRRSIPTDARFGEWKAADGWTCRTLEWRREEGAAARGSLLFAGGRGDFIEKYLEAYEHWDRLGWNVTAFDWRGQGASQGDRPGGHLDSFETLVGDLAGLIRAWRAASPGPHAAVAHSMGGHVLLRTLADRRASVDAAVLVAPMLMINSGPMPPFAAQWLASTASMFGWSGQPAWQPPPVPQPAGSIRQACLTGCRERYSDELWWWEKQPSFNLGAPSWGWLKAAFASCAALTPARLAGVEVPVLLIGTERDRLVSAAAIRRAAGQLPEAEMLMFDDAAHEILREEDAVRLKALAAIDSFLDRRAPR